LKTVIIEINNNKIRVQLWDTAGQEKYKAITKNLFLKVQGTLVVFDITNDNSFNNAKKWVNSIKDECGKTMQMILIGNKSDLEEKRVVSQEEASQYAEEEKIEYIETSSKTGENIQRAINSICQKILDNTEIERDFSFTLEQTILKKKSKCCEK
jgi:small GTP-binding protein